MTCGCSPKKRKVGTYESTQGPTEFCKTCGVTWPANAAAPTAAGEGERP